MASKDKKIEELKKTIKEDLMQQLTNQNKFGSQFDDMINNYLYYVELKERLKNDIEKRGIRYKFIGGNGFESTRPNESCERIIKVTTEMRKILQDLGLNEPDMQEAGENAENDLL